MDQIAQKHPGKNVASVTPQFRPTRLAVLPYNAQRLASLEVQDWVKGFVAAVHLPEIRLGY
jgi:hypothetical protein